MNTHNKKHLKENEILLAIVDETRLSAQAQQHLSTCSHCQDEKKLTEQVFFHIGERAKKYTPAPRKRPTLPPVPSKEGLFKTRFRVPVLATAALTVALVMGLFLWTMPPKGNVEYAVSTQNGIEMWAEEQFMLEIEMLAESTLPGEYVDAMSDADMDFEEAFIDYIVPLTDTQSLSLDRAMKGGQLC